MTRVGTLKRTVRRAAHVAGGTTAAIIAVLTVALGFIDGAAFGSTAIGATPMVAFCAVFAISLLSVTRRLRFEPPSARAQRISFWLRHAVTLADAELGLSLIAGCYAVITVTGGPSSWLHPLVYGVVAFGASFLSRGGAIAMVVAAAALEVSGTARAGFDSHAIILLGIHLAFLVGASVAHVVFLRGLIVRHNRRHRDALVRELEARRDSARDYRLISSALGADSRAPRSREEEERMLSAGGVETITSQVLHILSLLKTALSGRTAALLWCIDDSDRLKLKELVSNGDDTVETATVPSAGVVGATLRDRKPLLIRQTKPGQLPYYASDRTASFVGVPVLDGTHLRGVLCVDREEEFEPRDIEIVANAAEQIVRAVHSEHVFRAVERSKYEHERFYQASAMLCRALTLEQVMDTAFDAAAAIVDFEAAAITLYDAEQSRHRVYSVRLAPGAEHLVRGADLSGLEFRDNAGLASMVVKNKHFLPAGGEVRDITAPIYTKKIKLKEAESLLVLPLLSADVAIGTFMLASRKRGVFGKDVREMLGIIANQVAVSLQNGMMYKKMETMATTDGLTGLTNHRTFQERFADLLERSERHGHRAAVLLCDVDHFKKVNDNYGHPVGDEVLRRVARVLQDAARKIDIVARYGGEEFAVVLEATDLEGARGLAERIRQEVGKVVVETEKGPLSVNMSLGISAFPDDAKDRAMLIERADHALYHAKESGRNRVVTYADFAAARKTKKAS